MKKIILNSTFLLVTIALISSCNLLGGENFPPEPDIEFNTKIQNRSSHQINIKEIRNGVVKYEHLLNPGEDRQFFDQVFEKDIPLIYSIDINSSYFNTNKDSSFVVYDDSISVLHTKHEAQEVSRSWLLLSSYTGGKVNEKLYEIYYEFTDADYEEAVRINEGVSF